MVGFAVLGRFLDAIKARNARVIEGGVVSAAGAAETQFEQPHLAERRRNAVHQFSVLVIALQADALHAAGAGIVDEHAGNLRHLCLVRFDVLARADQALLLAGKQDEADRALGLQAELLERARGFQHYHRPRAIIGGASAQVPGVQMRAENHHLAGPLAAGDFRDGVIHLDGLLAEGIGDLEFDFHGAALQQSPDQVIVFGGDECSGQRANFVVAPADAGHVEQAVVFSGVAQDRRNALGLEEVVAIAVELLPCRTGKGGLRCWPGRVQQRRARNFVGRGQSDRLRDDDDGTFQFAFVLRQLFDTTRADVHHGPAYRAGRAGSPAGRGQCEPVLGGADDPPAGGAPVPGAGDRPRFEMNVLQAILAEHLRRPAARLAHLFRTGQARANHVR